LGLEHGADDPTSKKYHCHTTSKDSQVPPWDLEPLEEDKGQGFFLIHYLFNKPFLSPLSKESL
jgi:hypothetical protein